MTKSNNSKILVTILLIVFLCVFIVPVFSLEVSVEDTSGGTVTYKTLAREEFSQGLVTGRIYDQLVSNDVAFNDFYDMGIKWIRIEFEEFYRLPAGTVYSSAKVKENMVKFQKIIEKAHSRGIKVLGLIGANAMPFDASFPNSDESIQAYIEAVRWHLENYDIDAIEIWNEPWGFGFQNKLKRYAKLLIDTYVTLKPLYPHVVFTAPVTANAERGEWLGLHGSRGDKVDYEQSIFNCSLMIEYRDKHNNELPLDVISWHPYGTGGDPTGNFYFGRTFEVYYKEILDYKDRKGRKIIGDYPIWFTEYSWDSSQVGEEKQRQYYEKFIALINERPQIKMALLYCYRDDENVYGTEDKSFGIRKNSESGYTRKKSYYAFVSLNTNIGVLSGQGNSVISDAFTQKYLFTGGRKSLGLPYLLNDGSWMGKWGLNGEGFTQTFKGGTQGECALLFNSHVKRVFLLKGEIYKHYLANNGVSSFGWPISDEYKEKEYVCQRFDKGILKWKSGERVSWIAGK